MTSAGRQSSKDNFFAVMKALCKRLMSHQNGRQEVLTDHYQRARVLAPESIGKKWCLRALACPQTAGAAAGRWQSNDRVRRAHRVVHTRPLGPAMKIASFSSRNTRRLRPPGLPIRFGNIAWGIVRHLAIVVHRRRYRVGSATNSPWLIA